jgi:hypothetical protein
VSYEENLVGRKLGHEWYGWDGNIDAHEAFIREPKRLFLGIVFVCCAVIFAFLAFGVWGFYPRLRQLGLGMAAVGILSVIGALVLGIFGSIGWVLATGKPFKPADFIMHWLTENFAIFAWVASLYDISQDRLGYSLIEIHNAFTRASLARFSNGRILCLGPRCLDRDNTEQIRAMTTEYDCDFYMAPGGALARQKIAELKPAGIIGIACERDLVTGIRDIGYRIPVIGITNKRPIGPCKGAFIDMNELRDAIEVFQSRFHVQPQGCPAPGGASTHPVDAAS